jgi:signal transduction histidine kinase
VPLLREDVSLGAITLLRNDVSPFTDRQVALLQTFADQAVIAIENVRLFTELQASNRELTTALETQTATSDILRVISRSQTDVQPVFDAIVHSTVRLLRGYASMLTRIDGDQIALGAMTSIDPAGDASQRARFPMSTHAEGANPRAIRDRAPVNIADAVTDPRLSEVARAAARARDTRSFVVVPLLRHDEAIGTLGVSRREPGGFTDDEIALLQTFADQAVIAIENARLLSELQQRNEALTQAHAQVSEALEQQTATSEILKVISSSPTDVQPVFDTIARNAVRLCGGAYSTLYRVEGKFITFVAHHNFGPDQLETLRRSFPRPVEGTGVPVQRVVRTGVVYRIGDADAQDEGDVDPATRAGQRARGLQSLLLVPLFRQREVIGAIGVTHRERNAFTDAHVELLKTFADQAVIAIENVRLFKELETRNREIEDKSRQLEVASQHKSEFLANMSHELRTPLNAVIGFSEMLTERMFGELNEKQDEYVRDIHASGTHLLSLINDILDLSKIEAGRMELELADFHLPQAIDNALVLVRERALRRGISLEQSIDPRLEEIQGDERKVKQVLLNLLSNAIKFTPEGGRIEVRARPVNEFAEIAVSDTGIGIAPEDHEAVFEEFRQVGTAEKKAEATGLGLALARRFIELHGGRIWVESQVGAGSTFTFTLPVLHGE